MLSTEPEAIAAAYEASLPTARRRRTGAHFTPPDVAERLAELALAGLGDRPLVCDPACGAGSFLVAAGRVLERRGVSPAIAAEHLLWGVDDDAGAVAAARAAITAWSGVDPGDHLVRGDGLRAGERWPARFDAVVGNPPFLNQLERATVRRRRPPAALAALSGAYTDTAWLFLAAAPRLVRPGGRIVLIQPESVAAARDAAGVRDAVGRDAALEGMWTAGERIFAAAVRVCAPVLRVGTASSPVVARWSGRGVDATTPVTMDGTSTWSIALVAPDPPPAVTLDATAGTLADLATATAGFREQFYGLAPHAVDDVDAPDTTHPKLVTSGLIEPNRVAWGERPVRFAGRPYAAPRVDLASLRAAGTPSLVRWVEARLVPKVVVATQTKVLEAAVDESGSWVPSTPVIAVHARAEDLWLVAAALTAPPVSAWSIETRGGVALRAGAIKLSARQVLEVPLPADRKAWTEGARLLARGELHRAAAVLTAAHGAGDDVFDWWARRVHA